MANRIKPRSAPIAGLHRGAVKRPVSGRRRRRIRQTLDRLIIVVTNAAGVPRETTGWTATLTRPSTTISASFDDFGVARFPTISTLTTLSYTLRVRNADGEIVATRAVPADLQAFVVRLA